MAIVWCTDIFIVWCTDISNHYKSGIDENVIINKLAIKSKQSKQYQLHQLHSIELETKLSLTT